ncbi:MAG: sugar ABC transporter ATP-binding protein [Planctomycetota bacterium]|jgi:ABC-type sugar transport system ATPase subunit|nr:sugar ABC transporter ATP-binding protein [Planctomycetota bacterium]
MGGYFLEMKSMVKRFPGTLALDQVAFNIRPGETLGLIGENGAGKSTLVNILGGAFSDYEGEILVEGKPARILTPTDARALGIVGIRQELSLFPNLNVARNIFLGNEPRKACGLLLDHDAMAREAGRLLASFGLDISPETPLDRLTVAQKQMVEIVRALSYNAKLIIMDEPTSSLTEKEVDILAGIMADLKARGVAIILITHKLNEILRFCERVFIFRDGRNAGVLEKGEFSRDRFIEGMVGRDLGAAFRRTRREVGEVLLEVENLGDGFLKNISFKVGTGEILGLAGAVGAGRTEIMGALFGLGKISYGRIRLGGKEISPPHPSFAMRAGLALVPEERKAHGVIQGMSVRDNLLLSSLGNAARWGFVRGGAASGIVADAVSALNIRIADQHQAIGSLSGGNQQKAVLAKWLAVKPRVLLLDDPTRGIDVGTKREIYGIIDRLANEGYAIILSSSELAEVLLLSDRVLVLYEGSVKAELDADGLTEEQVLALSHA